MQYYLVKPLIFSNFVPIGGTGYYGRIGQTNLAFKAIGKAGTATGSSI